MGAARRARLRAFAKINLSLLVLGRRADGYHELRTIFQTISLADVLELEYRPARRTSVQMVSPVEIPDNLAAEAARMAMDRMAARGEVRLALSKRIPVGGGLGGGSSDAAAVLLALPVLAGRRLSEERLFELAGALGSDVPFFLMGGTALGFGRGDELYPLPALRAPHGLVLSPPVSVSTTEAYRALAAAGTELTAAAASNRMKRFHSLARGMSARNAEWKAFCENDFEAVVFRRYPLLKSIQRELGRLGAVPARMSGSGSSVYGVFETRWQLERALRALGKGRLETRLERISFVSREQYRAAYWRALSPHMEGKQWPPRSRYEG